MVPPSHKISFSIKADFSGLLDALKKLGEVFRTTSQFWSSPEFIENLKLSCYAETGKEFWMNDDDILDSEVIG